MIDFRLTTFVTLAACKSYTETARRLCITQPAVSQHIMFLEKYYGSKLVSRESGEFRLTQEGQLFLAYAKQVQTYEKQIKHLIEDAQKKEKTLKFGATLSIGEFALPSVMSRYAKKYPDTKLYMYVDNTEKLLEWVKEGVIDFALVEGYFKKSDYTSRLIKKEPFVMVCTPQHPLARQIACPTLEDTLKYPLIIREEGSGTREILVKYLNQSNYTLEDFQSNMTIGNLSVIKQMVRDGLGISFMYETVAKQEIARGELVQVKLQGIQMEQAWHFISIKAPLQEERFVEFFQFVKRHS